MTKCDLIDQLLQDLAESIQTGTDDEGRPQKYFTLGARNKVEVFVDRLNDLPVQIEEVSTWLTEQASHYTEKMMRFNIVQVDTLSKPVTASFISPEGKYLTGFGKTPAEAVKDAYLRQGNMSLNLDSDTK